MLRTVRVFDNGLVKNLDDRDFLLGTMNSICINYETTTIVLFYDTASSSAATEYAKAIKTSIIGPTMAACTFDLCPGVKGAMTALTSDTESPLAPYAIKQLPAIICYRKRWPVANYTGDFSASSINAFRSEIASNPSYRNTDVPPPVVVGDSTDEPVASDDDIDYEYDPS